LERPPIGWTLQKRKVIWKNPSDPTEADVSPNCESLSRRLDASVDVTDARKGGAVARVGGRDLCKLRTSRFLLESISLGYATASPERAMAFGKTAVGAPNRIRAVAELPEGCHP
jgi:hypothetical protein